jgi:predicted Zn-dependent protease
MVTKDFSYEIDFYERIDSKGENDPRVMEMLAQLYTKAGRISDGLSMDLRLSKTRPEDPLVHYNLACSLALAGQLESALNTLKKAVQMGYRDFAWMEKDSDLDAIRSMASYQEWAASLGISET